MLRLTPRPVSSSTTSRASGTERAQTIELSHHQRVAGATRRHRLPQPRPIAPSAGPPMIDIDPGRRDAERREPVALRGQVLRVGGDACVTDQDPAHARSVPYMAPSPGRSSGGSYGTQRPE